MKSPRICQKYVLEDIPENKLMYQKKKKINYFEQFMKSQHLRMLVSQISFSRFTEMHFGLLKKKK